MAKKLPNNSYSPHFEALRQQLRLGFNAGRTGLPVLPETAGRVISLANDPNAEVEDLCSLIHHDAVLAASVLRFANSAAYSVCDEITSLQQAVMRLGMTMVSGIAIAACLDGDSFKSSGYDALRRRILTHALVSGGFARELARRMRRDPEVLFMCGLLHSIGKPVLIRTICEIQRRHRRYLADSEMLVLLEEFHCPAGAAAAEAWKFPKYLRTVTAHYRQPDEAPSFVEESRITALAAKLAAWVANSTPPDENSVRRFPEWAGFDFGEDAIEELLEHGRCLRKSMTVSLA